LRRELKEMGTSFRDLLEEVRKQHALQCVIGTAMSVDEMATHLGFSNVRSFRRSFKRWTGQTPSAYRKAQRSAGSARQRR
jgi:AraC-like DNA-binding protein